MQINGVSKFDKQQRLVMGSVILFFDVIISDGIPGVYNSHSFYLDGVHIGISNGTLNNYKTNEWEVKD